MIKTILRWAMALFMTFAGVSHFIRPENFLRIMPDYLPYHLAIVYISGFFEIAGGVGLLIPRLRKAAAWGLVALYLAVWPANIYMAVHRISFGEAPTSDFLLWLRVALQVLLIVWAWWFTRPDRKTA